MSAGLPPSLMGMPMIVRGASLSRACTVLSPIRMLRPPVPPNKQSGFRSIDAQAPFSQNTGYSIDLLLQDFSRGCPTYPIIHEVEVIETDIQPTKVPGQTSVSGFLNNDAHGQAEEGGTFDSPLLNTTIGANSGRVPGGNQMSCPWSKHKKEVTSFLRIMFEALAYHHSQLIATNVIKSFGDINAYCSKGFSPFPGQLSNPVKRPNILSRLTPEVACW